jgi:hypothetical protein
MRSYELEMQAAFSYKGGTCCMSVTVKATVLRCERVRLNVVTPPDAISQH